MERTNKKYRMSRRGFLKGAGAALVLVAGGGVWRATDQGVFDTGQGPAYEPWENWREASGGGGPFSLVSSAILASNPHNSQPWLFRVEESRIDLFADRQRNIGAMDPFLREMYIGLGCALENLLLAAEANGYGYDLTLVPNGSDPTHAARIELSPGETIVSELYETIPDRHTDRAAYDTERPIRAGTLDALGNLAREDPAVEVLWFAGEEQRRLVGNLIVRATEAIIADEEQSHDSHEWFRHDWDELQRNRYRDGVTIDTSGNPALTRAAAKMLPSLSAEQSNGYWLDGTKEGVRTAAAFGIITVGDGRNDEQRMRAGRLWQRMHLWATKEGLAMQPENQLNERDDREAQLGVEPVFGDAMRELVGDPRRQGIFAFRLGYPTTEVLRSPRRAVEEVTVV
ncbi:MAG: Acg family FMN-binding oxidoreductase [Rubrobacteraceae bacterium]